MAKTHVLSVATRKRRSRASKPSSYHVREREMSRRRMKIRRHMDKAQDRARTLKRLLDEGDRKEIESLSGHARHCLLRDLFATRNKEYYPGMLGDKRKLHRVITKMELNEIDLKVAEFEIYAIEVDEFDANARLVNGSEGGVGGAAEEGAAIRLTNTTQAPEAQAFCRPCSSNSQWPPDLQNNHPLKGGETHPSANGKAEAEIFVTREKESTDYNFSQFNGAANSMADSDRELHDMHDFIGLTRESTVAMDLSLNLHPPPVGKSTPGMGGEQRRGMHGHAVRISRQHPPNQHHPPPIACDGGGGMTWRRTMPNWGQGNARLFGDDKQKVSHDELEECGLGFNINSGVNRTDPPDGDGLHLLQKIMMGNNPNPYSEVAGPKARLLDSDDASGKHGLSFDSGTAFPSRTMDAAGMPQMNACGMDLQEMTITNYQATKTRMTATALGGSIGLSGLYFPSVVLGNGADVAWRAMSTWKHATQAAGTSDALVGRPPLPNANGAKLQEMTMVNMNLDLREGRAVKGSPYDRGKDAFAASRRPAPSLARRGEPKYNMADSPFKEQITDVEIIKRHIKDHVKDIIRRDIRRRLMSDEPFPDRASSCTAMTTNATMPGSSPDLEARQVRGMWATGR